MPSIKISRLSKLVIIKINNLDKAIPKELQKSLYFIGKKLKQTASQNILKKNRKGRVYRYKGRNHTASVPFESWANRSGKARRGLYYKVNSPTKLTFGNNVDYSGFLEDGTRFMKRRPAHVIAIRQNTRNILKIIERNISDAF